MSVIGNTIAQQPAGMSVRDDVPAGAEAEIQARALRTAWLAEGGVISVGLLVAIMIGVQTGGLLTGIAAAAPFVAAATVEFARIPLARMAFACRGLFFKGIAIAIVILAAGAATALVLMLV